MDHELPCRSGGANCTDECLSRMENALAQGMNFPKILCPKLSKHRRRKESPAMQNEILQQILDELKEVKSDVRELKSDVGELKSDVRELKSDVRELKSDVGELKSDVGELKSDVSELKSDVKVLKQGQRAIRKDIKELYLLSDSAFDDILMLNNVTDNLRKAK